MLTLASTYTQTMPTDWDGKVEHPKLVCERSGAPIPPGAWFWSALEFRDDHFVRHDVSEEAWKAVDRSTLISWWRQRAPTPDGPAAKPIDIAALLGIFHALKDETQRAKQCFCYVVMLFLVRARKLRFKEVIRAGDESILVIEDKANGCVYRIRDPHLSAAEEQAVQENLRAIMEGSSTDPEGTDTAESPGIQL